MVQSGPGCGGYSLFLYMFITSVALALPGSWCFASVFSVRLNDILIMRFATLDFKLFYFFFALVWDVEWVGLGWVGSGMVRSGRYIVVFTGEKAGAAVRASNEFSMLIPLAITTTATTKGIRINLGWGPPLGSINWGFNAGLGVDRERGPRRIEVMCAASPLKSKTGTCALFNCLP